MTEKSVSHGRKSISVSEKPRELITKNPRLTDIWTADVITLFPESFPGLLGESLIGSALAKKVGAKFIDIDTVIEKEENLKISEIFSKFGEKYFRNIEEKIISFPSRSHQILTLSP